MFLNFVYLLILFTPILGWTENTRTSPYIHEYEANYIYEGDDKGDYKGNFIAVLNDGSHWIIHSKDVEEFAKWNFGDKVHIGLKIESSWYFFTKHHFVLVNHECNKSVEVLLLQSPLTVSISEQPHPTECTILNYHERLYKQYRRNITASDKQPWEIKNGRIPFLKDSPIYVGYNDSSVDCDIPVTQIWFFIINETGKESKWSWVRPGNYKYLFE